jgi:L-threonylcarbamoyladenylate synthase
MNNITNSTTISTDISRAVELLKDGEIVALPTETVYGLAGNALNPTAIEKIFSAKNRPQDNPLIVHVSDMKMVKELGLEVSELAERLAERFWGGPLTMVLKKVKNIIPPQISCGLDSVAVRVPNNRLMLEAIERCDFPLAAPSANLSGRPSPTTAQHVYNDLNGRIPLIIDGGACRVGIESTVITINNEQLTINNDSIQILRPGVVTSEMLSEFGEVVINEGASKLSPGTRHKHYSPKAKVIAVDGSVNGFEFKIEAPETQTLYARFREFDELGADVIYVKLPKKSEVGLALHNRIMRAAEFNVIKV